MGRTRTREKRKKVNKYASVYYNPSNPGSFGGLERLWREVGGSKEDVKDWLKTQTTYTLHRPARKRFKRNRIQVAGLDDQWEADLVDVQGLSKYNNNFKHLLTVIDSLSKYAFVVPLKDKTGTSMVKAFTKIFKTRKPRKLRTDKGKEFLNKPFQDYLKKHGIIFFTSNNETKSAMVERFNRTLREKMWRYFTATGNQRYVDVLQNIVDGYNDTTHSTTDHAPKDVNVMNAEKVWRIMYKYGEKMTKKKPSFKVGELVRINKAKKTFEKGYRPNWTREVFKVTRVYKKRLPEYKLHDLMDEEILGRFLGSEIQTVNPQETQIYKISKILKKKGKESLVTWRGFPNKFKTWILTHQLKAYR